MVGEHRCSGLDLGVDLDISLRRIRLVDMKSSVEEASDGMWRRESVC